MTRLPSSSSHFWLHACARASLLFALVFHALIACAANDDAPLPAFDILEYEVHGNTRLSDIDIERAVTPFLGPKKTLNDVESARAALERVYRDAGYPTVVVSIPEQKVDEGVVQLAVTEGRVDRLRVKNADYHPSSEIRKQVPELAEGQVPYFPQMQRELDALNQSPDMKITPVLKPGRVPGTVEVNLEVDDQLPLHANVELNNRQSVGTRPLRLSGSVRYDNLWQSGHTFGLTAQVAPQAPEQMKMLAANYMLPVGAGGQGLALYAVHSSSNVPGVTSVLNNSDVAGLRWIVPLPMRPNYAQSLSLGLDYKDIHKVESIVGGSATTTLQPAISYAPLVAAYNGTWLRDGAHTAFDATTTLGLRNLLGNSDTEFAAKRYGASAQYAVLRVGAHDTETLGGQWSFTGHLEAQFASDLLLPNEQYAAGGVDTVRGYLDSEQTGDRALRISAEVRTPTRSLGDASQPWRLTGLAFYDAAKLTSLQFDPWTGSSLPALNYYLRGVGLGLRLTGPKGLSLDLDLARALSDGGTGHDHTKSGDYRAHVRLLWEFL